MLVRRVVDGEFHLKMKIGVSMVPFNLLPDAVLLVVSVVCAAVSRPGSC